MEPQQQSIQEECIKRFESLSSRIPSRSDPDEFTTVNVDSEVKNLTDTFRWFRNNSPRLNENTKNELLDAGLLDTCMWFCNHCFINETLSRSVLLQFLANFSMNNEIARRKVFQSFYNVLRDFILSSDDEKLLNSSVMLLYNLCLHNDNDRLEVLKDINIIQKIMTHWIQGKVEYSKIFLDSIFLNSKDFLFVYSNLPNSAKNQLLDILSMWLEYDQNDVSIEVIVAVKDNFFTDFTIEQITSKVVDVLAKASSIEKFKSEFLKDTKLLEKIMDLLIVIHEHSKNSNDSSNEFSRVNDLSALFSNSQLHTHTRYWFKSDIIRLIANMCYNQQEHQNLMRTKNIIPILLECCSFDAKNPLMREWSLFALRNILEGNLDNQNFVANIDSVGSIDPDSSISLTETLRMATIDNSISNNDTMFI